MTPGPDPLVAVVVAVVENLEAGRAVTLRSLAKELGMSFSTCQRLHGEARRRGWLDDAGVPTESGLLAGGRI